MPCVSVSVGQSVREVCVAGGRFSPLQQEIICCGLVGGKVLGFSGRRQLPSLAALSSLDGRGAVKSGSGRGGRKQGKAVTSEERESGAEVGKT